MTDDRVDAAVVGYTVRLAHELGLRVVAEGVEDAEVYRALRDTGCDAIQGNFISAALPADEVGAFVAKKPETARP
ncbi:MAG: EAL domain-containing protein [Actinobacteria bacterium]|nr:EAL domain-containing protein [Actinomycetota bacterium]